MDTAQVKSIDSLRRGLDVLALLSEAGTLQLKELHEASGIPKASLLRILRTLIEAGRVQRRVGDGAYMALGARRATRARPAGAARLEELLPVALRALAQTLPWPSDVGVCTGSRMRVIDSNRQAYGASWRPSVIGAEVDLMDSALGRAFLAFTPEPARAGLIEGQWREGGSRARRREAFQKELQLTLARGYGSRDGGYPGPDSHHGRRLSSVAVPVLVRGQAAACISCVWNVESTTREAVLDRCLAHLARQATWVGLGLEAGWAS